MSQSPKPRGLGRGLSALLGDEDVAATVAPPSAAPAPEAPRPSAARPPLTLPIAHLRAGKFQPRTSFEGLDALVDSVRQFGLLQPILVRPVGGEPNAYEIIAGERRWRAAQQAQLHDVPVVVRPFDNLEACNRPGRKPQRADLSPIDEAAGYERLRAEFNQTQEESPRPSARAARTSPTRSACSICRRSAELVRQDKLSAGHGRTLLAFADPIGMAAMAVREKLSVRDLERLAAGEKPRKGKTGKKSVGTKTADTKVLEKRIEDSLGIKASLALRGVGEQTLLTLEIRDFDQLDAVVERLTRR